MIVVSYGRSVGESIFHLVWGKFGFCNIGFRRIGTLDISDFEFFHYCEILAEIAKRNENVCLQSYCTCLVSLKKRFGSRS